MTAKHARTLSLAGGTAIVLLWTLLRHITNGINYDVVGQIGLAQQWAAGQMLGVQLGTTSYLLKIPVYFLTNQLDILSPMNRILLLAALFNVITFVLLFILFEKILKLYKVRQRTWLYLSMAWLATIAGNVFWIDHANSRNLEAVGGILLIYLVLRYIQHQGWPLLVLLGIVSSLVFFADPLQLYVCGLGICLFVIGRLAFDRTKPQAMIAAALVGITTIGYLGSQVLFALAEKYLNVTLLTAPQVRPELSLANAVTTFQGLLISTFKIFDANFARQPYGFATIRELLNAIVLIVIVAFIIKLIIAIPKNIAARLAMVIIAVNYIVYAASGQVSQWETSRYLIMVPLLTVLIIATSGDQIIKKRRRRLQHAWLLIIVISGVMLMGALAVSWPDRHSKDKHIGTLISFMHEQHFRYALSSREVGVTTTYFSQGKVTALPLSCETDHSLRPTNLFYDIAAYKGLYAYADEVPIILPADGIKFGSNTCTRDDVIAQFGTPKRELAIEGVGTAMIYDTTSLHMLEIDKIAGSTRPETTSSVALIASRSTLTKLEGCSAGTIDVIVAHPDDDILFMNPDIANQLSSKCFRSVYVTAGDDGRGETYWRNREHGIETAYATMFGADNIWTDSISVIDGHDVLTRSLVGKPSVSLVFLRLPDGGVDGQGFSVTGDSSIEELSFNRSLSLTTVDGTSGYTYMSLNRVIRTIIFKDSPTAIFTTVSSGELSVGDHSDHAAVGHLVLRSASMAKSSALVSMYVGYPANNMPENLPPDASIQKRDIFNAYAYDDALICASDPCSIDQTYGNYFSRSYKVDQTQPKQPQPTIVFRPHSITHPKPNQILELFRPATSWR